MELTPSDTSVSSDQDMPQSESLTNLSQSPPTKRKLPHEVQSRIVACLALWRSVQEIKDIITVEFGMNLPDSVINYYRTASAWRPQIEKIREEFDAKIADEEFSSKRRRIQEYTSAYYRLKSNDATLMDSVNILSKIREEIEGKTSGGNTINQYNQYNGLSDEDLRKIIDENTKFLEIADKRKKAIDVEVEGTINSEGTKLDE